MSTPLHAAPGYDAGLVRHLLDIALDRPHAPFAIAGLQGTGKSTLSAQIAALAATRGLRAVVLSIDDFYLDRPQRLALGREVHPLLATRGPPGTHDVALACEVVDALLAGAPVRLPRFDKIADVRLPVADWPRVQGCGLVVFEGWFLRVPPQAPSALAMPLNALERDEDADGAWRRYCNDALARDYAPLWARLPRLLFLRAPAFEVVPDWRWQQECTLQAANPGRRTMTRPEVERFVQLFERTSRQALATLPSIADATVRLDAARVPDAADVARLRDAFAPAPTIAR